MKLLYSASLSLVILSSFCWAFTQEEIEISIKVKDECQIRTQATDEDVNNQLEMKLHKTRSGKCFLSCLQEYYKIVVDHKVSADGFKLIAAQIYEGNEEGIAIFSEMVDECHTVTDPDKCELSAKLMECIEKAAENRNFDRNTGTIENNNAANLRRVEICDEKISNTTKKSRKKKSDAVILIKPKKNQNSDKTEDDVKQNINPQSLKFSKICKGPNGGVAIVCDEKLIEKIVKEKLSDGYNVQAKIVRSKIKIVGIDKLLSSDEILSAIKNQNSLLESSDIKFIYSYVVKRTNTKSVVIEMDSELARKCLNIGELKIMWKKCHVYKQISLYSCYKCNGFNHKASQCKNEKSCRQCAGNHDVKQCDSDELICINCKIANKNFGLKLNLNHKLNSNQCTVYKNKVQALENQVAFDFSD
ncbi:putative 50 kDa protein in type I retrotransposable element R1DM [Pseudolycoriella hygida]|uniref:50 kDa protein in type I retrotransposable element R1DM n=1 Tax=Pseudolycoriella hygida TaxID=35572 RepID=A0A9Q0NCF8_9DIPT|nr:putative 50 kDa protein in type I retrotransposable element R1DM [Pseudolycoriella hygida]